jgi:hypothetical protein
MRNRRTGFDAVVTDLDGTVIRRDGFAMGNAPDDVRSAATSHTASVEDDGFARTLRDVGLIPRDS